MTAKRRPLSLSGVLHARLKAYCKQQGVSMASFVEQLIEERATLEADLDAAERRVAQMRARVAACKEHCE